MVCELTRKVCDKLTEAFNLPADSVFCTYSPPEMLSYGPLISDEDLAPVAYIFNNLLKKMPVIGPNQSGLEGSKINLVFDLLDRMRVPRPELDVVRQALKAAAYNAPTAALALRKKARAAAEAEDAMR